MPRISRILTPLVLVCAMMAPFAAHAAPPDSALRAVVRIVCSDRQGSGIVTNAADGYVVTAAHVALDVDTRVVAQDCTVDFPGRGGTLRSEYAASVVRSIFDVRTDRDFAILKLGVLIGGPPRAADAQVPTNEFSAIGDPVTALGYPGGTGVLQTATGVITAFTRGTVHTTVPIAQGYSGGPVLDTLGNLMGIATRIAYKTLADGTQQNTDFEMGDVVSLLHWMDEEGHGAHDAYVTHHDPARYDGAPYVTREETSPCTYVVHLEGSHTLQCLLDGHDRLVFPNEATYRSWYGPDAQIYLVTPEDLSTYRLIGNVTMKAGSLVKIQTDPKTYLVTDSFGTLRWIKDESTAIGVFGPAWATKVRDVPDVFFTDYRLVDPAI
ncbi:MAG: hypothetical protein RLZZ324_1338 [Candidatus Parcubacteria bacterium]|jgi:V8-like Glu-specific endopeptidase